MTNPFPFTVGQVLTAAQLNEIGAYTAYTPTWTNLTVGNGTNSFVYAEVNDMVHLVGEFVFGSTSVMGSFPAMTLPITRAASTNPLIGTGNYSDTGTATFLAFPLSTSTTTVTFFSVATAASFAAEGTISSTAPFTWTTTDRISVNLIYRAA